jgi:hypothetical protein
MKTPTGPTFPSVDQIMAYEAGELDETATVELFQSLVDSGMAWRLQGHYGRTATDLIEAGLVDPNRLSLGCRHGR